MKLHFILVSIICIVCCSRAEKSAPNKLSSQKSHGKLYFLAIEKKIQPSDNFIKLVKNLNSVGLYPLDSLWRFNAVAINIAPAGVDSLAWNNGKHFNGAWSIGLVIATSTASKKEDVIITEYLLNDSTFLEPKTTIPVDIFGTFTSNSKFFRLDSSVLSIDIINPDTPGLKKVIWDSFYRFFH